VRDSLRSVEHEQLVGPFRLAVVQPDGTLDPAHVYHDEIRDASEAFASAHTLARRRGLAVVVLCEPEDDPMPRGLTPPEQIAWETGRWERLAAKPWTEIGRRSPAGDTPPTR
jgi:hypothetical protein